MRIKDFFFEFLLLHHGGRVSEAVAQNMRHFARRNKRAPSFPGGAAADKIFISSQN
jgi:hypothetical protein